MSKFKFSTHVLIDQTVKELMRPPVEVGKTYLFKSIYGVVERPVVAVENDVVTYLKGDKPVQCSVKTFQRLYEQHGLLEPIRDKEC